VPEQFTEEQMKRLGLAIVTALRALREQIKYTHIAMHKAGKATSCELPEKTIIIRAVVCLKNKLNRHITSYGVHQTDIDFYKVTAWLGMMLYKNSGAPPTFELRDLVGVLNAELKKDHRSLPPEVLTKIATMAKNDGHSENDDLGVGMNGLYLIFRACYKLSVTSPSNR
jgi:hypothetical protein